MNGKNLPDHANVVLAAVMTSAAGRIGCQSIISSQ